MESSFKKPTPHDVDRELVFKKVTVPAIKPAELKAALDSERSKTPGAKIRFVDCQSKSDNAGKEFRGAVHMNIENAISALPAFNAIMSQAPATFDDLASADMVVFYCRVGAARSPATLDIYRTAIKTRNPHQFIVLLEGGIEGYEKEVKNSPDLKAWTGPDVPKTKTLVLLEGDKIVGPKPNFQKLPQPGTSSTSPSQSVSTIMWTESE